MVVHNFIKHKLEKLLNCFIYPTPKFQVMIANTGTTNHARKCHIMKLTMGNYLLDTPMIAIPMGGMNVVLVVQ